LELSSTWKELTVTFDFSGGGGGVGEDSFLQAITNKAKEIIANKKRLRNLERIDMVRG